MNLATVLVATVVLSVVAAIVFKGYRNKKQGKGGCSCGGNCGACNICHNNEE